MLMLMSACTSILTTFFQNVTLASESSLEETQKLQKIKAILDQQPHQIDFAKVKITVDKIIDSSVDAEATSKKIDRMTMNIISMFPPKANSMQKLLTIKKYLYSKGNWNNNTPFKYDFNDPMGTMLKNKLLSNYLITKKGNCISMPILFLILGQKVGLNVSLSTAPHHVFVKYTDDDTGQVYNIETTNSGNFMRSSWYQKYFLITEQAIEKKVYLNLLSKREAASVVTMTYGEHLIKQKKYQESIDFFSVILEYYPKSIFSIISKANTYYRLIETKFMAIYPRANMIPHYKRAEFKYYQYKNKEYFWIAEQLGWREPPKGYNDKYRKLVKQHGVKP